jgi:hypothetical protein
MDRQAAQTDEQPTWRTITTPEEHEDFPGQMLVTRDQRTIMAWAQQRDAVPVAVRGQGGAGLDELRLDIRGASDDGAGERVSWDDWLRTFTMADLRFVYQERTADGNLSTFYRLDPTARQEGEGRSA